MAYTLGLHVLPQPARKSLAQAALVGVESVTAGHGVPKSHPERLAIQEGYQVLENKDPAKVPACTYGSIGADPSFYASIPARFKSADMRFQAQLARVRTLDKQEKAVKAWHARDKAAKEPSLADLSSSAQQKSVETEHLSVDVDFSCMRMSSNMHHSHKTDKVIVDEHGYLRPASRLLSSSKCFRIL